jgi:uncharacterized RDD family membrane protein YckC
MNTAKPQRHLLERTVAYMIDAIISCGLLLMSLLGLAIAAALSPDPRPFADRQFDLFGNIIAIGSFVISFVLGFGYFLFRDGFVGGSLGKRLFGLAVVDIQTRTRCSYLKSFVRNFFLLILQGIELLIPFFTRDGRRCGDYVVQTIVVKRA